MHFDSILSVAATIFSFNWAINRDDKNIVAKIAVIFFIQKIS
jgi:hypothetical protein